MHLIRTPWAIMTVLFVLVYGILRYSTSLGNLSPTMQWSIAGLMWFALLGPGTLAGFAVLQKGFGARTVPQHLGWFFLAVIAAVLVGALPMALFFAHDAPNDYSIPAYYLKLVTHQSLYMLWAGVMAAIVVLRMLAGGARRVQQRFRPTARKDRSVP